MEEKEKSPGRGPGEDTARDTVRAALRAYETFAEPRDWEEIAAAQREWREYWEADSGPDQDDSRDEKEKFAEMFRRTFSPFARLWNPKAKWGNYNAEERSKWYKYMYEAARRTADDPEAENCIKQYFRELYRKKETGEQVQEKRHEMFGEKGKEKGKYEQFRTDFRNRMTRYPEFLEYSKSGSYLEQSLYSVTIYLTMRYPEEYYIYRAGFYKDFVRLVSGKKVDVGRNNEEKMRNYESLCEKLRKIVCEEAPQVVERYRKELGDEACDPRNHLLLADILCFCQKLLKVCDPGNYPLLADILGVCRNLRKTEDEGGEQQLEKPPKPEEPGELGGPKEPEEPKEPPRTDVPLNLILYGPPGTGKTYNTVIYAVAAAEGKLYEKVKEEARQNGYPDVLRRFRRRRDEGQIAFVTFHQAFGYEDFVEGIRPVLGSGQEKGSDGRKIRENSPAEANRSDERNGCPGKDGRVPDHLHDDRDDRGQSREIQYEIEPGVFKSFCGRAEENPGKNYIFIIDEINRGNISKIFGELITLIEPGKRLNGEESTTAVLPYSREEFGVPRNVYLLGTMNTADRSIAAVDTALRRRFDFRRMMPDLKVLEGITIRQGQAELSVKDMLDKMNKRISYLYDQDHSIGHAYFTPLGKIDDPKERWEKLQEIFRGKIFPLLQEYFYEEYDKIRLVLGDNQKKRKEYQFVTESEENYRNLFGEKNPDDYDAETLYEIQEDAFQKIESYLQICYSGR